MTSRFERLGMIDKGLVITLAIATSSLLLPMSAHAQVSNQQPIVFEIKTSQIPNASDIADFINGTDAQTNTAPAVTAPSTPPTPIAKPIVNKVVVAKTAYRIPAKTTGDARIYMQEPEIRAYICPKLGDRCNTFLAILAGENGTHECTRDNRGTNKNGSVDIGLAQINWTPNSPYTFEQLQDCKFNLDVALSMVARRGFQPWYVYTKGLYKAHLPAILASAKVAETAEPVTN